MDLALNFGRMGGRGRGPSHWEGGRSQKGQTKVPRDCWGGESRAEGCSQVAGDL